MLLLSILTATVAPGCASQETTDRQQKVHSMGSHVMPFDLDRTQHVFQMTDYGGIQQVVIRDPKHADQVPLIRQHLRHEAMLFSMGDFSDPTSLHGEDMPGVRELEAGASRIIVTYSELPDGAQLTFGAEDIPLITAIHRWFGAQLSDHGADATSR